MDTPTDTLTEVGLRAGGPKEGAINTYSCLGLHTWQLITSYIRHSLFESRNGYVTRGDHKRSDTEQPVWQTQMGGPSSFAVLCDDGPCKCTAVMCGHVSAVKCVRACARNFMHACERKCMRACAEASGKQHKTMQVLNTKMFHLICNT